MKQFQWKRNGNCVRDSIEIITYTPVLVSEYSANNPRMPLAHLRLQTLNFFPNIIFKKRNLQKTQVSNDVNNLYVQAIHKKALT